MEAFVHEWPRAILCDVLDVVSGDVSCIRIAIEIMSIFRISKLSGGTQAGTSRAVSRYHIYTTHLFKLC